MVLPHLLAVVLLVLSSAPSASREVLLPEHEEASVLSALAGDDECLAGPDSSLDAGCGLHALQFRGRQLAPSTGSLQSFGVQSPAAEAATTELPTAPRVDPLEAMLPAAAKGTAASGLAGSSVLAPHAWHQLLQDAGLGKTTLLRIAEGLCLLALGVLAALELAARVRHRARFHECQRKVQQVHLGLVRKDNDLPLCPYCIEPVQNQQNPSKVVFLCGHSFHLPCANGFFREHQERAGLCPICCEGMAKAETTEVASETTGVPEGGADAEGHAQLSSLADCDRSFLLTSLRRMYPETISEACMLRWSSCHVEIWLQELTRPKYKSILCRCR